MSTGCPQAISRAWAAEAELSAALTFRSSVRGSRPTRQRLTCLPHPNPGPVGGKSGSNLFQTIVYTRLYKYALLLRAFASNLKTHYHSLKSETKQKYTLGSYQPNLISTRQNLTSGIHSQARLPRPCLRKPRPGFCTAALAATQAGGGRWGRAAPGVHRRRQRQPLTTPSAWLEFKASCLAVSPHLTTLTQTMWL